uniref:PDZ domain-containing protein n=1 Tax=Macrostomum lignano TaxID=282301 RepID=A0A1I8FK04_9PLAT
MEKPRRRDRQAAGDFAGAGRLAGQLQTPAAGARPRIVRIRRDAGQSLGISIVGGPGGRPPCNGTSVSGIFIKHVSGQDLRDATHDEAPTDSDSPVAKPASPDRQQQQPPPTRTQQNFGSSGLG